LKSKNEKFRLWKDFWGCFNHFTSSRQNFMVKENQGIFSQTYFFSFLFLQLSEELVVRGREKEHLALKVDTQNLMNPFIKVAQNLVKTEKTSTPLPFFSILICKSNFFLNLQCHSWRFLAFLFYIWKNFSFKYIFKKLWQYSTVCKENSNFRVILNPIINFKVILEFCTKYIASQSGLNFWSNVKSFALPFSLEIYKKIFKIKERFQRFLKQPKHLNFALYFWQKGQGLWVSMFITFKEATISWKSACEVQYLFQWS